MDALIFLAGLALGWLMRGARNEGDPTGVTAWSYTRGSSLPDEPQAPTEPDELSWDLAVVNFAVKWTLYGCSVNAMRADQVVTRPAAELYISVLYGARPRLIWKRKTRAGWLPERGPRALRIALKHGLIALPYPATTPPVVGTHAQGGKVGKAKRKGQR